MMDASILDFKNVSLILPSGKTVLDRVNLNLENHQSMTIIGHNGAGKSSLLKLIVGDKFCTEGELHILGHSLKQQTEKKSIQKMRSEIGFIHQGLHLVGRKNAIENVLMGRLPHNQSIKTWFGIFNSSDYDMAYEALKEVKMSDKALMRADKLSGGERQKVAIARALAQSPKILLADEPTAALDPKAASEVAELLRQLVENKKLSLITVVHSLDLINKLSHRVVIMKQGQILFDGDRQNISPTEVNEFYNT
ncbi:ATP-binding cassette domain-containing protein [Bacteriovorax sp. PP10]|uniref:ATP-binding cassette domain-containing protein n=1 Tax=Bacteriovorax antarcticus TaxID=3088717 RepID=A0ABU5VZB8_9BACT|nr:ATP-binding cassette domain-containing protein [Bacteriovorax sp. PP10]MEA9358421.1 ATP-binding cassette domain-containing protein [Bacteriovorax sp. PP10]